MKRLSLILVPILALTASATEALACAVCGGDPDSPLVKGAEAGVLLMVVVTYGILLGFVGVTVSWIIRSRRMKRV